jgi:adenylosuccinate synthase
MSTLNKEENKGLIRIVVGGQFGSESKGLNIEKTAHEFKNHVRTGAIQAGHTVYFKGSKYAMQSIPCGWVNGQADLFIGAGAYIEPELLEKEIKWILGATGEQNMNRLYIDQRAGLHKHSHIEAEEGAGLHQRMGSTAHGCMEAAIEKMRRGFTYENFADSDAGKLLQEKYGFHFIDVSEELNSKYDQGEKILIEGTQGTMLDLFHGYYPYVTSRSTIAANWLAEVGLSPTLNVEVVMVIRTYPIRVAGNSGPLADEMEWVDLARDLNKQRAEAGMEPIVNPALIGLFEERCKSVAFTLGLPSHRPSEWSAQERKEYSTLLINFHKKVLEELGEVPTEELKSLFELTTVTKKLRRIGGLNIRELKKAINLNRPNLLAVHFLNYRFADVVNCNTLEELKSLKNWSEIDEYIKGIEKEAGVKVGYISTNKNNSIEL